MIALFFVEDPAFAARAHQIFQITMQEDRSITNGL
jgi:hypothetical protein